MPPIAAPIRRVVVLGAGSAGWLSALAVKKQLPETEVVVVSSPSIPVIGVGESTTPAIPRFLHRDLGLEQARFHREVRPSWKLGIRLEWGDPGATHFNYPFDRPLDVQLPGLSKVNAYYCMDDLTDVSHSSALMDRGKSPVLVTDDGGCVVSDGHAYHLENAPFLNYLRHRAIESGVRLEEGEVVEVPRDERGDVRSLRLSDGREITGDLFLDCSGFRSLLLGETMGETFRGYGDSLFCDAAVIGSWRRDDPVRPYTTAETMDSGWCWRIDFLDHVTRGYVFSTSFCSPDEAEAELRAKNPRLGDSHLRLLRFRTGRYENAWVGNVVGVGNSAGFIEPLEATALQLIVEQLRAVCRVLIDSDRRIVPRMVDVENRRFRRLWDDVRDFLAVHYRFNRRSDSPFWRQCRADCEPHGAAEFVEYYREAGPSSMSGLLTHPYGIFGYDGFMTMLLGQRVPTRYRFDPDAREREVWEAHRAAIRRDIERALPMNEAIGRVYGATGTES